MVEGRAPGEREGVEVAEAVEVREREAVEEGVAPVETEAVAEREEEAVREREEVAEGGAEEAEGGAGGALALAPGASVAAGVGVGLGETPVGGSRLALALTLAPGMRVEAGVGVGVLDTEEVRETEGVTLMPGGGTVGVGVGETGGDGVPVTLCSSGKGVGVGVGVAGGVGVPEGEAGTVGEGVPEGVALPVRAAVGVGETQMLGGVHDFMALLMVAQKAPEAAAGGTARAKLMTGGARGAPGTVTSQHSTPAVLARTTQLKLVPPISMPTTSPWRWEGTTAAAGLLPQQLKKPEALRAQARQKNSAGLAVSPMPAPMATAPKAPLATSRGTTGGEEQALVPPQHRTV